MYIKTNKKKVVMHKRIYENTPNLQYLGKSQRFILFQAENFLKPFMRFLYTKMDIRLVKTFFDAFMAIILHRDRDKGLLLSELGGFITGFSKAPSGTKRLSNLFRSKKWSLEDIELIHLQKAQAQVTHLETQGHRLLGFIDDSTIEKSESWWAEGLCSVYSSKAKRLTRIKPGYYNPPKNRICVPGYQWTALMIGGFRLTPIVGLMKWWTTKGQHKECADNIFYRLLKQIKSVFGSSLTLVLDRAFANLPTLERLFKCEQDFIIRWKSGHLLTDLEGQTKNTWRICHGKKSMDRRTVWDKERKNALNLEIIYAPVLHPECLDKPMTLVVIRPKNVNAQHPMYLLTNQEIDTSGMAWEMFFSYIQRWDIEQAFRFLKSELGIQSIRLHEFKNRLKLMALVTLVFEFLLTLYRNWQAVAWVWINTLCPRTDKRFLKARLPIYRLRMAMQIIVLKIFYLSINTT